MDSKTTFTTEREALAIPAPATKPFVEHYHAHDHFFGIRIMRPREKDGRITKTWVCRIYEGGSEQKKTLGRVNKVSWAAARAEAGRLYAEAQESHITGAIAPTFAQAFSSYVARRKARWAPDTLEGYKKSYGYLEALGWGSERVDRITQHQAQAAYEDIQQIVRKANKKRKRPIEGQTGVATATGVMRLAKIIFNDLKEDGIVKANPCKRLIDDGVFERAEAAQGMIHVEQLPAFWNWIHTYPPATARDYLLIEFFTGFRRSIMGSLAWENLRKAVDGRYYYILHQKAKGNKAKKLIPVPLCDHLVENVIKPRMESPTKHPKWILESNKWPGRPVRDLRHTFAKLQEKTGIDISDHDFRRTIASITHLVNDPLMAARILTHKIDAAEMRLATTGGYIISTPNDLLAGMNRVVDFVLKVVKGELKIVDGEIVSTTAKPAQAA